MQERVRYVVRQTSKKKRWILTGVGISVLGMVSMVFVRQQKDMDSMREVINNLITIDESLLILHQVNGARISRLDSVFDRITD